MKGLAGVTGAIILLMFVFAATSCITSGEIITTQNDTLPGRIRAGEDGAFIGQSYIDYRTKSGDRYHPVNLDTIKWIRLMNAKDTIVMVPVKTTIPLRRFIVQKHLWTVLGIRNGFALCSISWKYGADPLDGDATEVILVDQKNDEILEVISTMADVRTKSQLNQAFLKFINKRYRKDFTMEDFKDQKSLLDYILKNET